MSYQHYIKHFLFESDREELVFLMERYGAEAYGVYWLLLEQIAKALTMTAEPEKTMTGDAWAILCHTTPEKISGIISYLKEKGMVTVKDNQAASRLITIRCDRLLNICGSPQFWSARRAAKTIVDEDIRTTAHKDFAVSLLKTVADIYPVKSKSMIEEALPVWEQFETNQDAVLYLHRLIKTKKNAPEWEGPNALFIPPLSIFLQTVAEEGILPLKKDRMSSVKYQPTQLATIKKLFDEEIFPIYPEHRQNNYAEALTAWIEVAPEKEADFTSFTNKVRASIIAWAASPAWTEEDGKWVPGPARFLRTRRFDKKIPAYNGGSSRREGSASTGAKNQDALAEARRKLAERGY